MDVALALSESDWNVALGVLVAYAIIDGLYAYYTVQVVSKRALSAAGTGAFMHVLIAIGVLSYVQNFLYIVPIAVGSFVGTYVTVRLQAKRPVP